MTFNPLHNSGSTVLNPTGIQLLAILRFSDKTVVASFQKSKDVTIEGIRECVSGTATIQFGKKYTSQGANQAIHFILDAQGRVYSAVTVPKYPPRVVFAALDELVQKFSRDLGARVITATEGSLSRAALPILREIFEKYENPAAVDKLASVNEKIDVVKSTMKENIQQLLINEEAIRQIETKTEHLNEQSVAFKQQSKELKDKMWWKMWKMRLLIGGLIVAVLIIIIVPIAVSSSSTSSSSK